MSEKSCGIYDLVYFDYLSIKLLIKWAALSKGNWHKYSKQTNNDTREIYSLLTTDSPWCYNISITRNSALLSLLGGKLSTGCTLVITTSGPNISLDMTPGSIRNFWTVATLSSDACVPSWRDYHVLLEVYRNNLLFLLQVKRMHHVVMLRWPVLTRTIETSIRASEVSIHRLLLTKDYSTRASSSSIFSIIESFVIASNVFHQIYIMASNSVLEVRTPRDPLRILHRGGSANFLQTRTAVSST